MGFSRVEVEVTMACGEGTTAIETVAVWYIEPYSVRGTNQLVQCVEQTNRAVLAVGVTFPAGMQAAGFTTRER